MTVSISIEVLTNVNSMELYSYFKAINKLVGEPKYENITINVEDIVETLSVNHNTYYKTEIFLKNHSVPLLTTMTIGELSAYVHSAKNA